LKEQEELRYGDLNRNDLNILMRNHSKLDLINVKKILFRNMGLTRIEPEIFSELPNLKILDLSKSKIAKLDTDLFKHLKALKTLNLSENMITK
jgi:Leucine-rich repeat (LRR) protein